MHSAVHGFLSTTYNVTEGNRVDTLFQLNMKGETHFSTLNISGTISVTGGTASE